VFAISAAFPVAAGLLLLGSRLDWTVLVVGLAWRAWLLRYTLPFLAAALDDPVS
jgi:hypothetical protein